MRYLLTFWSTDTGQWRCLDTARLHPRIIGRAADLAGALNAVPDVTMGWMMGHRLFGDFRQTAGSDADGTEWVRVHALGPDGSALGRNDTYYGVWLEMFMLENKPAGWVPAHRPAHPLHRSN